MPATEARIVQPAQAMAGPLIPVGVPVAQAVKPGDMVEPQVAGTPVAQARAMPAMQRVELPGKRKSLLIGINYFGTKSKLNGCIADVKRMRPLLEQHGFPSDDQHQMVLLDDPGWDAMRRPTLQNMRKAIRWLTHDAKTGDALFFHYSGHGGRQENAHAQSGYVETLCPEDYKSAGMLLDTELFETLVRPLPSGCRLTCLMDCCHSGGVLNLPYLFTGTPENLREALKGQAVSMVMSKDWLHSLTALKRGNPLDFIQDVSSMGLGLWGMWNQSKRANETGFLADEEENIGLAVGEVVAITGCRSDQTSADVGNVHADFQVGPVGPSGRRSSLQIGHRRSIPNTAAGGALTSVFMESLQAGEGFSYLALLERIRSRLEEEDFDQVPQLATSLLIELNQPFSMTTISLPLAAGAAHGAAPGGHSAPGGFGGHDGARAFGGGLGGLGGGAGLGGVAAAAGRILQESDNGARTGALLASFMSSMSGGSGQQMLQSAGVGGAPSAGFTGGAPIHGAFQGLQPAASSLGSSRAVNVTEVNQTNVTEVNQTNVTDVTNVTNVNQTNVTEVYQQPTGQGTWFEQPEEAEEDVDESDEKDEDEADKEGDDDSKEHKSEEEKEESAEKSQDGEESAEHKSEEEAAKNKDDREEENEDEDEASAGEPEQTEEEPEEPEDSEEPEEPEEPEDPEEDEDEDEDEDDDDDGDEDD